MIGRTLAIYFAGRFLRTVVSIFLLFAALVAAINYFQVIRQALMSDDFDAGAAALAVLLRLPTETQDVVPFAVLFGSIAAFVGANKRLEVVVARAAGLSAWQFLLPAAIVGALLGVMMTTIYTPVASVLATKANSLNSSASSGVGRLLKTDEGQTWIRQTSADQQSIVGAATSYDRGLGLREATAFVYDQRGKFVERIDAPTAEFIEKEWLFHNATITAPDRKPTEVALYRLGSSLSREQVGQAFERPMNVSFWVLPSIIEIAKRSGIPSARYQMRYHSLLSMPILLLAMVLIAAIVSLRFSRSRNIGRMVLSGIAVGFMLYVGVSIARDMGSGGVVPPPLAAWLPAIVATLFGVTVLLHLEDG